jgi:hypothetical protein
MFRFRFTMVLKRNVLKDRKIGGAKGFNFISTRKNMKIKKLKII